MSIVYYSAYYSLWAAYFMGKTVFFRSSFFFTHVLPIVFSKGWDILFLEHGEHGEDTTNNNKKKNVVLEFTPEKEFFVFVEKDGVSQKIIAKVVKIECD